MTDITNVAGYYFTTLDDCAKLKLSYQALGKRWGVRGTILLSTEGINVVLSGSAHAIEQVCQSIQRDPRFAAMRFKISHSDTLVFKRFLVKVKPEIITLKQAGIKPQQKTAERVSATTLKQWLDEGRPVVLLDTRNDYEIAFGHFNHAVDLKLQHFVDFPAHVENIDPNLKTQPIVTYCTGGIRCEKASAYLLEAGFNQVYQLDGGILQYFAECGNAHYAGECFVFDKRIAVDHNLQPSTAERCRAVDC